MNLARWSIWKADLEPVKGSEQGNSRPVLILSNDASNAVLPVVNVLPLTTRKPGRRIYPNEVLISAGKFGLTNESIVLCYQIRTLDKQRLIHYYGDIDDEATQEAINSAPAFQLGMKY